MYFCHIENVAYGEINERSLSNPYPSPAPNLKSAKQSSHVWNSPFKATQKWKNPDGNRMTFSLYHVLSIVEGP